MDRYKARISQRGALGDPFEYHLCPTLPDAAEAFLDHSRQFTIESRFPSGFPLSIVNMSNVKKRTKRKEYAYPLDNGCAMTDNH